MHASLSNYHSDHYCPANNFPPSPVEWQNGVASSREIARERFVEIPALHQASV